MMKLVWYELLLKWGAISFGVVVLIPILGLMPELSVEPGWWKTEAGIIYLFVAVHLFVSGAVGFVGALYYELRRVRRPSHVRRNVVYALIALNFFAGTLYYLAYAVWQHGDQASK